LAATEPKLEVSKERYQRRAKISRKGTEIVCWMLRSFTGKPKLAGMQPKLRGPNSITGEPKFGSNGAEIGGTEPKLDGPDEKYHRRA
jgi:hypothetical protein